MTETYEVHPTARVADDLRIVGTGTYRIGALAVVESGVLIDLGQSGRGVVILGARSKVKHGTVIRTYNGSFDLGKRSSLGEYGVWASHGGISIGANAIVGPHCTGTASEHIFEGDLPIRFQGERAIGIAVGDDVWLGAGVHLLDGVSLGSGCIVGAGSVVTRSVPDRSVALGSPARLIRRRERLVWNHDHQL